MYRTFLTLLLLQSGGWKKIESRITMLLLLGLGAVMVRAKDNDF